MLDGLKRYQRLSMKVIKFRIRNYKSIVDSGDCYFSDGLTILAGKNESGKTSILEALEDFQEDKLIREDALPISYEEKPQVDVSFELDSADIIRFDLVIHGNCKDKVLITIIKKYGSIAYHLDSKSIKQLGYKCEYQDVEKKVRKFLNSIDNFKINIDAPKFSNAEELIKLPIILNSFNTQLKASLNDDKIKNGIDLILDSIKEEIQVFEENVGKMTSFIDEFVEKKLPYFILFSSFEDNFPESITVDKLPENEWAKDLENISPFRISNILSEDEQARSNHQRKVNIDFSNKFKKFWNQDEIKLEVQRDGDKINFWIVENETNYKPSQRSKGQQWYLSFYIKIVSRIKEDKPNVILIDEPGLYLHAKAQKDLLKVLKEHSSSHPVVFSTHSPYLIEVNNLESIRLVEKRNNEIGSQVIGKIHSHSTASKETLTPILTAIGLGVNDSIINLEQENNIVVEGPSDVFYLQALRKLYPNLIKFNFINGGGATNMGFVGAILQGWGANVIYLFDNDKGKKQGEKKLKDWSDTSVIIKESSNQEGEAIEDIFSCSDFKKYVLENQKLKYTNSNSKYVKDSKQDKVLLARKFLQKVDKEELELDKITQKKVEKLFLDFNCKYEKK